MALAIKRWLQNAPKSPEAPPAQSETRPADESPPSSQSNDSEPPSSEKSPWPKNHSGEGDDTQQPPTEPFSLPAQQPKGRSVPFHTGQDVVDNIKRSLANDWHQYLDGIGRVVDATGWIKDQVPNIVAEVDFYRRRLMIFKT